MSLHRNRVEKMPTEQILKGSERLFISNPELGVDKDWFSMAAWKAQNAIEGTAAGRGTVWFIKTEQGQYVLRRYRRGGLIAKLTQFNFLFRGFKNTRPYQELKLLEFMREQGLPVPEPIAGHCQRIGVQYQAEIITKLIPDAKELFTCLLDQEQTSAANLNWYEIGKTIKRLHDAGVNHTDLNCHNIMIDLAQKVWIIDFDKCHQASIAKDWQEANLLRLKRSFEKEASKHPNFQFKQANWQTLLEGYHG